MLVHKIVHLSTNFFISAGHKIGGGYAFSYESNSNSSTVSNDGDNNGVDSAALESTAVGNDVGIAESSVEPAEEPDTTIVSEPSTPTAMSPKGEKTVTATTPTPAAEIKAPVTLPREPVETAETTADTATEGHAPTATASTPQSLIGSLVSSISNSAKKIPMGVAEGLTGAAAGSQGSHADMTASEAADKAGREAGRDKDKDKDKEILLLKKALKKKTQVSNTASASAYAVIT